MGSEPSEKFRRTEDRDSLKLLQREEMLFVAADDEVGLGGEGAFQNHFVVGIRGCASGSVCGENQVG